MTAKSGAPQKKCTGAALADEARAECFENTIALQKHPPKAVGVLRVICSVSFVLIESNRFRHFVGFWVNLHHEIELFHFFSEPPVKSRDGLRSEWKTRGAAVIALDLELVSDKVEVDLKRSRDLWNRAGGETPWR